MIPILLLLLGYLSFSVGTEIHSPGYCSLYGQCGKKSLFGKDLPCEANVEASRPTLEEADLLKEVCGWDDVELSCCDFEQLTNLKEQVSKVTPIIGSCPACKENFYQFFCHFTCSPDQSTFINVTKTDFSTVGKKVVTELDEYVSSEYASKFFDSCKNIKFSLTNGYAMDLIGGGAKNYQQFLKFLGDEKPMLGGSPFQINYKFRSDDKDISLINETAYDCNDSIYRCACPDCQDACPDIPDIKEAKRCYVGVLPCLSFSVIIIYSVLLLLSCWIIYYKNKTTESPLLVDSFIDEVGEDDEDNDDDDLSVEYTTTLDRKCYLLNEYLELCFGKLGFYCALYPKMVISISLIATLIMSSFMAKIKLETKPVNLWVSPNAELYKQKIHFDENFGPFYRTQQIFLVNETGPILQNYETLKWWFAKEKQMREIVVQDNNNYSILLNDLCFQPTGDACIIESFTQYFHGDFQSFPNEDQYLAKLRSCIESPVTCLPDFQQPLNKNLLFGGFDEELGDTALDATAIVVTFLLNNDVDDNSKQVQESSKWELLLQEYLLDLQVEVKTNFSDLKISFNTESSLEKELNKSTNTDVRIIILSYLVMFAYASLALGGKFPGLTLRSWTTTKFSLGLIGIFIVLLSVASSAGICALFGIKSTLIIAEVIPFLVLAVGVDNIFLITNEFKKCSIELPQNMLIEEKIGVSLGKIGPSILISSTCQFLCFSLASAVSMPAVKNFAIYCAGAVLINAILQVTCFVSVLSLDEKRFQDNRLDILPFIKLNDTISTSESGIIPQLLKDDELENNFFHSLMKNRYAPLILKRKTKSFIVGAFILWFGISLSLLPNISLGLDQRIAIPSDSFLIEYFNDIYDYLNVGPPIYFVIDNLNLTLTENQQKVCGKFAGCNEFSFGNVLEQEYNKKDSIIADPLSSWLDDFFLWLNPDMDQCCRVKKINNDEFCLPNAPSRPCEPCYLNKDYDYSNLTSFPHGDEFLKYYSNWIDSPSDPCPLGGKAPYSTSIKPDFENKSILSSVFRTSHLALRSQEDFIKAYGDSLKLVSMIKDLTDIDEIYAYSPFYIFFMQYTTIVKLAFKLIAIALLLILGVSSLLLGSFRAGSILVATVIMIMADIGGMMAIWGISLNAVSLVNLIICIGIAVEFCVHIVRGYMFVDKHLEVMSGKKESVKRAYQTLVDIGGSVFGGITMTKLIGVMVLAFTRSKIFEIYYFRMWLSLIIVLSLHSLMFLPVVLSYVGGEGYFLRQDGLIIGDDLLSRLTSSYDDVE